MGHPRFRTGSTRCRRLQSPFKSHSTQGAYPRVRDAPPRFFPEMSLNAAPASGPLPVATSNGPGGPVLALDLGGTHLRTAVVGSDGVIHARRHGRAPIGDGADAVIAAARASLEASREEHVAGGGAPPVALGVSAPGPLDSLRGVIIDPPNLGRSFWGLPLAPGSATCSACRRPSSGTRTWRSSASVPSEPASDSAISST